MGFLHKKKGLYFDQLHLAILSIKLRVIKYLILSIAADGSKSGTLKKRHLCLTAYAYMTNSTFTYICISPASASEQGNST